jgi:phosphoserine phosphatase RsbU/P
MIAAQQFTQPTAVKREANSGMNILVIDDSEDHRELTEAALHSAGYRNVRCAASAAEGFQILGLNRNTGDGAVPVDIVLLDIVMPEMDGIEACAHIRSHHRYEDVPIIMVTSLDDMDNLASAFVAGANDYISKPVNRIELLARVRAALKLKNELEQRRTRERELLNFVSGWSDRRAGALIDEATGLFTGEAAEAYLTTSARSREAELISVITLMIDRLEQVKTSQGETVARAIQAGVAKAVRATAADIGVLAASYPNGLIVVVAPDVELVAADKLAQTLRGAIAGLAIGNREFIAQDHVTASVAVVSGRVSHAAERTKLLMRAIAGVRRSAAEGGSHLLGSAVN